MSSVSEAVVIDGLLAAQGLCISQPNMASLAMVQPPYICALFVPRKLLTEPNAVVESR